MARTIERYTAEELATLAKLVKDNSSSNQPLSVADLAMHAENTLPGRSADALKQRIFKMQREATTIKHKKVAVKKLAKAAQPARVAKPAKNPILRRVAQAKPYTKPYTKPASALPVAAVGDELTLTLPNGARVSGRPAQIAEFARQM